MSSPKKPMRVPDMKVKPVPSFSRSKVTKRTSFRATKTSPVSTKSAPPKLKIIVHPRVGGVNEDGEIWVGGTYILPWFC